ncbi:hypothetical protein ACWF95_12240, partial [Streptomyces vinaceus]
LVLSHQRTAPQAFPKDARPDPRPGVFRVPGGGDPSDLQRAVEDQEIRRHAPRREVAERSKIGS